MIIVTFKFVVVPKGKNQVHVKKVLNLSRAPSEPYSSPLKKQIKLNAYLQTDLSDDTGQLLMTYLSIIDELKNNQMNSIFQSSWNA